MLKMDPSEVKNINIAACHRIQGSRDATTPQGVDHCQVC